MASKKISIIRVSVNDQSISGELYVDGVFIAHTLELPFRNNLSYVSSIPPGTYDAFIRYKESYGWRVQLKTVPERSAIQIHKGTKPDHSKGCILIGNEAYLQADRLEESKIAYKNFEEALWGVEKPGEEPQPIKIQLSYSETSYQHRDPFQFIEYISKGKWRYQTESTVLELLEGKRAGPYIYFLPHEKLGSLRLHLQNGDLENGNANGGWQKIDKYFWLPNRVAREKDCLEFDPFPGCLNHKNREVESEFFSRSRVDNNLYCRERGIEFELADYLKSLGDSKSENFLKKIAEKLASEKPDAAQIRHNITSNSNPYLPQLNNQLTQEFRETKIISEFFDLIKDTQTNPLQKSIDIVGAYSKEILEKQRINYENFQKLVEDIGFNEPEILGKIQASYASIEQAKQHLEVLIDGVAEGRSSSELASAVSFVADGMKSFMSNINSLGGFSEKSALSEAAKIFDKISDFSDKIITSVNHVNEIRNTFSELMKSSSDIFEGDTKKLILEKESELLDSFEQHKTFAKDISEKLNDLSKGADAFSAILASIGHPELAQDVQVVANAGISITNAAVEIFSGTLTGAGMMGPVGAIAGAALGLYSHFGRKKTNPNKAILNAVQQVGKMIVEKLAAHMDKHFEQQNKMLMAMSKHFDSRFDHLEERFDRVEKILKTMTIHLDARFDRIEDILGNRFDRIESIMHAYHKQNIGYFQQIESQMSSIYQETFKTLRYMTEIINIRFNDLKKAIADVTTITTKTFFLTEIGFKEVILSRYKEKKIQATNGFPITQEDFEDFLTVFHVTAIETSTNASIAGISDDELTDMLQVPIESRINAMPKYLNLPTRGRLANPAIWADAANSIVELIEWKPNLIHDSFRQGLKQVLTESIETGRHLQDFIFEIRSNPAYWEHLFDQYETRLGELIADISDHLFKDADLNLVKESRAAFLKKFSQEIALQGSLFSGYGEKPLEKETSFGLNFLVSKEYDLDFNIYPIKGTQNEFILFFIHRPRIQLLKIGEKIEIQPIELSPDISFMSIDLLENVWDLRSIDIIRTPETYKLLHFPTPNTVACVDLLSSKVEFTSNVDSTLSYQQKESIKWLGTRQNNHFAAITGIGDILIFGANGLILQVLHRIPSKWSLGFVTTQYGNSIYIARAAYIRSGGHVYIRFEIWEATDAGDLKFERIISQSFDIKSFEEKEFYLTFVSKEKLGLVLVREERTTLTVEILSYSDKNNVSLDTIYSTKASFIYGVCVIDENRLLVSIDAPENGVGEDRIIEVQLNGSNISTLSNKLYMPIQFVPDRGAVLFQSDDFSFSLLKINDKFFESIHIALEEIEESFTQWNSFVSGDRVRYFYNEYSQDKLITYSQKIKQKIETDVSTQQLLDKLGEQAVILKSFLSLAFRDEFLLNGALTAQLSSVIVSGREIKKYLDEFLISQNKDSKEFLISYLQGLVYSLRLLRTEYLERSRFTKSKYSKMSGNSTIDIALHRLKNVYELHFGLYRTPDINRSLVITSAKNIELNRKYVKEGT